MINLGAKDIDIIKLGSSMVKLIKLNDVEVWPGNSAPGEIIDFVASDNLQSQIEMSWTHDIPGKPYPIYNLYELDAEVASGISSPFIYDVPGPYTGTYSVQAVNDEGEVFSNEDEGIALEGTPTPEAPVPPQNFSASDSFVGKIELSWSTAGGYPAPVYEVIGNSSGVITSTSGLSYTYNKSGPYTDTFYVVATNSEGSATSPSDSGTSIVAPPSYSPPSGINNLQASDDEVNKITIEWTDSTGSPMPYQTIHKNGQILAAGVRSPYVYDIAGPYTAEFYVNAVNTEGSIDSNSDNGTAIVYTEAPSTINDFEASDDEIDKITFSFTLAEGSPSPEYELREDNAIIGNILPGESIDRVGPFTASYKVNAYNGVGGGVPSNSDDGTSVRALAESGSVTIDFNTYSYTGSGNGTVTISNGTGTFTPPTGVTIVSVTCVGGGGGGAASQQDDYFNTGGGHAGGIACAIADIINPSEIRVGYGGQGGFTDSQGTVDGDAGTDSYAYGVTGSPGLGGTGAGWYGNGGSNESCGYTSYDGLESGSNAYGGQGAIGDGGEGRSSKSTVIGEEGGTGAGGGGANANEDNSSATHTGGRGGDGQVIISWEEQ